MKKLLIAIIALVGAGCSTSDMQNDERINYELALAESHHKRAIYLGELPGTPENIEAIQRAQEQAREHDRSAFALSEGKSVLNSQFFEILESKTK